MSSRIQNRRAEYLSAVENVLQKIATCGQLALPLGVKPDIEWQYFEELNDIQVELATIQADADKLLRSKNTVTKEPAPLSQRLDAFVEWLHCNGVSRDVPVQFVSGLNEGIGAIAKRDIAEGEDIISIPRSVLFSSVTAYESKRMRAAMTAVPNLAQLPAQLLLVLHLVDEKNDPNSFWKPYLDVLPETFALPVFFDPEDMTELQSTTVFRETIEQLRSMLNSYVQCFRLVEASKLMPIHKFTWSTFRWALGVLQTRQNLIPAYTAEEMDGSNGQRTPEIKALALIPGWDMFNHREGLPITSESNIQDGSQHCASPIAYKAGTQVYIAYTTHRPNRHRFLHSGFLGEVPRSVAGDFVRIVFRFPALKDVDARKDLARTKFGLQEPFPLDLCVPIANNYDNVIGTLACAVGTPADLAWMQERLEDLVDEATSRETYARNARTVSRAFKAAIGDATASKDAYVLECAVKIINYVKLQATMLQRRLKDTAASDTAALKKLANVKSVRDQFHKNVLQMRAVERIIAQDLVVDADKVLQKAQAAAGSTASS
ncbi:Histone-lysine N-methyltransferase setd3 [Allomyces arbusculus]|nr:Histone-lysine N-methyltransferase setd3 [Allomyces arbusculus]